jgi:hypothetical protein
MKNSHKKAKRSNFLIAAEAVDKANGTTSFVRFLDDNVDNPKNFWVSPWACNVLCDIGCGEISPEQDLFKSYFKPDSIASCGGWWHKNEVDARVIGLLLCAEMLRR